VPNPDEWYKKPNAHEFVISLLDEKGHEIRFRQRWLTKNIPNSKKKEVKIFSVGLEIQIDGRWEVLIRHCNYNTDSLEKFHTHHLGKKGKTFLKLAKRQTPGSQMRWANRDIRSKFREYIKHSKT